MGCRRLGRQVRGNDGAPRQQRREQARHAEHRRFPPDERQRPGPQKLRNASPSMISGGASDNPARLLRTQAAARRLDSWVPAWSSQTVIVTSPPSAVRSAWYALKPGTLARILLISSRCPTRASDNLEASV